MANWKRLLRTVLRGTSDASIGFSDLCGLMRRLGFDERIKGSHHIWARPGVEEIVNLQHEGGKAKPYQVRQVRRIILKYGLGGTL